MTAPRIEAPVDAPHFAPIVDHKGGTDVTHPRIVSRQLDDTHRGRQAAPGVGELLRGGAHRHRLKARDGCRHRGKGGLGRLRLQAPVVGSLGPEHPTAGVKFEFARHTESVGSGPSGVRLQHATTITHGRRPTKIMESRPTDWADSSDSVCEKPVQIRPIRARFINTRRSVQRPADDSLQRRVGGW